MNGLEKKKPPVDYLELLKEQFNTLQTEHIELRRKYEIISAATSDSSNSFPSKLLALTASLLNSSQFSDIQFIFPTKNQKLPAHRFVIAARTNHWKDLENVEEILIVDNVDFDAFQLIYKWFYTDKIDLQIDDQSLLKVCDIACMFKLESLQMICVNQLSCRLNIENCVLIYEFAEKQNLKMLAHVCGKMIATSWSQLSGKHFSQMTAPVLYRLIDQNTENVLHSIVDIGRDDVLFLFFMQNASKLSTLLNASDSEGSTALEKALIANNFSIAEQIIEKGANINQLDANGETILMRMIRKKEIRSCDFLLKHDCDAFFCHSTKGYNVVHVLSEVEDSELTDWFSRNSSLFNINAVDEYHTTPLMKAIKNKNFRFCEALLEAGVDLNILSIDGRSALANCFLSDEFNFEIANLLIGKKADVNIKIDECPLIIHVLRNKNYEGFNLILSANDLDVQLTDNERRTAFHIAAENSDDVALSKLIQRTKDGISIRDNEGRTPLDISVSLKNLKCARILIKGGTDVNERDENGESLLEKAIVEADDEMGVFLLDHGAKVKTNESEFNYLERSCENGLLNTTRALILAGLKVNQRNTAGYSFIETALRNAHFEVASLLISFGCDIESNVRISSNDEIVTSDYDWNVEQTLLHAFIDSGEQDAAVFLINNRCDINSKKVYKNPSEDDQFTPTHMAVSWGQNLVLAALIKKGADLNLQDSDGRTPCHIGVREKNMEGVRLLLEAENVDFIQMRDKFGQTVLSQAMINKDHEIANLIVKRQPHAVVQTNGNGENLLHVAIKQNDLENVLFLLAVANADATRNVNDGSNKSPLHLAALAKNEMILRNLILANNQVNLQSTDKCTPLLDALKNRNHLHASILLENGADPNLRDEHGENALLCAVRSGSSECIKTILSDSRCRPFEQNNIGFTSLHICAMLTVDKLPSRTTSSELCEILLNNLESFPNLDQKQFAAFIDSRDADGNTALLTAYSQGNASVCRSLLRRRACMGTRNNGDVNVFTYETATKQLLLGLLESLEFEPRWSDGDTCDCGAKFSLTQRKHHCRHCGRHVCSKCSETTMPIAKYGEEKRVRVCDVCAHVISTGTAPRRF